MPIGFLTKSKLFKCHFLGEYGPIGNPLSKHTYFCPKFGLKLGNKSW